MKKILLSVAVIGVVAAISIGATVAYFSDTETSTGNTFTAGALDLKVDSTCHYYQNGRDIGCGEYGNWSLTDLTTEKFFYFTDIKPGDNGEDTVSLHVDKDAWLRLVIDEIVDNEGNPSCTEPEEDADATCSTDQVGDLRSQLLFTVWLDQGVTPGFQGPQDLSECDNDYVAQFEPVIISEGSVDPQGETWELDDAEGAYLKGGEIACFGIAWRLPESVGNDAQTDTFGADMTFEVEQYRNNPTPSWDAE